MTIVNLNDGKKGDKGDRGDKGEAALTLTIEPKTFVFETDDKGIVLVGNKRATIALYEGTQRVTPDKVTLKMDGCNAEVVNKAILNFKAINPNTYSGYVEVTATCKGQVRTATAEFMVSAQKWNEANFLANEQQFQSIIIQNKADKQGLEKRMSTIEHDAKGIRLEVSKQTFSGVNMLKGASLRLLDLLSLQRAQYVTIGNDASVAHLDNPYVAIVRHGAPQNEWNGCKFPVTKAIGGRTYTVSMFTRIYGRDQPYLEIKRSRSKDMTDPKTDCPDIPSTWGQWKQYTHTFDLEEGYNYLQIFIGFTRDGEAYLSEVQLEEGTKATAWKDPDVAESLERSGINIDKIQIVLQSGKVFFRNEKGELTAAIDEYGAFRAGSVETFDKGGGHIVIHDNLQEFYKPNQNSPCRRIGYIGDDWKDQRLDKNGNIIWELTEQGIVRYKRSEHWEKAFGGYYSASGGIKELFDAHGSDTLNYIFRNIYPFKYDLMTYYAPRGVRGEIIASSSSDTDPDATVEMNTERDGKLYVRTPSLVVPSRFGSGLSGVPGGAFRRKFSGVTGSGFHHYRLTNPRGGLQGGGVRGIPPEYTNLKKHFGLTDEQYKVDFNVDVWQAYLSVYDKGICLGSCRIFSNIEPNV